ncbi:hypothetical protein T4D_466 [Trichinella pseudospiralis]|uniref:Uncharacterized protein n=1 Tax=Trichinella pseudospiralis TaxID=6337 RepID=A0A0V1F5L3_TRIPS|nr:hypothetical protein T4D_466 [Trichinella pseudospiralis]
MFTVTRGPLSCRLVVSACGSTQPPQEHKSTLVEEFEVSPPYPLYMQLFNLFGYQILLLSSPPAADSPRMCFSWFSQFFNVIPGFHFALVINS